MDTWVEASFTIDAGEAEVMCEWLFDYGAEAITYRDPEDNPIYEPGPQEILLWPNIKLVALFQGDICTEKLVTDLAARGIEQAELNTLQDRAWERTWLDYFKPQCFGERLWICPTEAPIPDPEAVNVLLDPGLAFGTGTHPTTAMCLTWLDKHIKAGQTVVDYGCGSGILGICALKLGAEHCWAVDIDDQALAATKMNAKRNDITPEQLSVLHEVDFPAVGADVLIANILAEPLLQLADKLTASVKPGGQIMLSGILQSQYQEIEQVYSKYFVVDKVINNGEWSALSGSRLSL